MDRPTPGNDGHAGHTRVVVVESMPLFREGLLRLLTEHLCPACILCVPTLTEGWETIRRWRPSLVILDRNAPGEDVFNGLAEWPPQEWPFRIVVLGLQFSDLDLHRALHLQVHGCFLKNEAAENLQDALLRVLRGCTAFSPALEFRLKKLRGTPPFALLSGREREVLVELAKGYTVREIAERLNLKPKTVGSYKTAMMTKLKIHNRVALVHYAIREGLVPLGDEAALPHEMRAHSP